VVQESSNVLAGVDAGTTLVKLAVELPSGRLHLEKFPSGDPPAVVDRVASWAPAEIGVTGGGAASIAELLPGSSTVVNEFTSWSIGARRLLQRADRKAPGRFLLVSLGTGTSIQLIEGSSNQRIGGTALGGGTVMGLGRTLTDAQTFDELSALAATGSRTPVDLVLSDVYDASEVPHADHITAASFGKLAGANAGSATPADLAAALINLVAENVGLIVGQLASATGAKHVVVGGSTLDGNRMLATTLTGVLASFGCTTSIPPEGEYSGALGALELVNAQA